MQAHPGAFKLTPELARDADNPGFELEFGVKRHWDQLADQLQAHVVRPVALLFLRTVPDLQPQYAPRDVELGDAASTPSSFAQLFPKPSYIVSRFG